MGLRKYFSEALGYKLHDIMILITFSLLLYYIACCLNCDEPYIREY